MKKLIFILINVVLLSILAFCPRPYHFDINKGVEYLNKKANKKSQGLCAQYVRKALEAGGCSTWGHPMCAKDYKEFLRELDFTEIDKEKYKPRKGDIVVFDETQGHPFGHIAMWNGTQWISDFKQRNKFVGIAYRKSDSYTYFRMLKTYPMRKYTIKHHINGLAIQPCSRLVEESLKSIKGWI